MPHQTPPSDAPATSADVLERFAEPLVTPLGDDPDIDALRNTYILAMTAWNVAVNGSRQTEEMLLDYLRETMPDDAARQCWETLRFHKTSSFPDDHRLFLDVEVTRTSTGHCLEVSARLPA